MEDPTMAGRSEGSVRTAWVLLWTGIVLALAAGGYHYYRGEIGRLRLEKQGDLASIGELKARQIVQWRKTQAGDAVALASETFFAEGLAAWKGQPDAEALRRKLLQRLTLACTAEGYSDALVWAPDGRLLLTTRADTHAAHAGPQPALDRVLAGAPEARSDLYRCPRGIVHTDAFAPIRDEAGGLLAVLALRSDADAYLYPLIRSWPIPCRSAETLLVAKDGDSVLYLNDLRHQTNTALSLRIPMTRTDLPAVQAVLGRCEAFDGVDYRGVPVLADLRPVPDSPWFLVTKVDAVEIMAEARKEAALVVLSVLILALLAALAIRRIFRLRQAAFKRVLDHAQQETLQTREELRATLYGIGDAVISTDDGGRVRVVNPVAEQLTGWCEADARGRPLAEVFRIINEDSRQPVESPVSRILREGVIVGLANHTLLIARDGRESPIADSGAPVHRADGTIAGVVLVFRDQTADRATQAALREQDELRREIGALAKVGGWEFDVRTGQGTWTEEVARIHDMDPSDPTNASIGTGVYHGESRGKIERAIREAVEEGRPYDLELEMVTPKGNRKWVRTIGRPVREGDRVARVRGSFQEITDLKRAEQAIRENEERYRTLYNAMTEGVALHELVCDAAGKPADYVLLDINPAFERITGLARTNVIGRKATEVYGTREAPYLETFARTALTGTPQVFETAFEPMQKSFLISVFSPAKNRFATVFEDVTERNQAMAEKEKLEAKLLQSQKMEAVGRLAGGVAHDFNNRLTVILGYVEQAIQSVPAGNPLHGDLLEIQKAARFSADLTRQLLAFARRQTIAPKVLDLNECVERLLKMLRRLIGEDIDLLWQPATGLWPVKMDPAQIDQILANLAVNARDAIRGTGRLTIETANVEIGPDYGLDHIGFPEGRYVMLAVSDDGCGMDEVTRSHLFEPFFTTKGVGKGTGLGLATVHGIVKQNGGFINVYSEPGQGTTFRIYIPRDHTGDTTLEPADDDAQPARGTETVLLVEDEPAVLELGARMLEQLGYTVLSAEHPKLALQTAAEYQGDLHLLMTDVVMPEMDGRALRERLLAVRPGLKCLFMSGYTANAIAHHGVLEKGVHFLQKPFTQQALAQKLREALAAD